MTKTGEGERKGKHDKRPTLLKQRRENDRREKHLQKRENKIKETEKKRRFCGGPIRVSPSVNKRSESSCGQREG